MYQGNVGLLKNRTTGESRWYQKLRMDDSSVKFVDLLNNELLCSSEVNERNSQNRKEKPWSVVHELSTEAYLDCMYFNSVLADRKFSSAKAKMEQKQLEQFLKKRKEFVTNIGNKLSELSAKRKELMKQYTNEQIKLQEMQKSIQDGTFELPKHKYVYGKHTSQGKEFCWIDTKDLDISLGDTISVDTYKGEEKAIVTRIEYSTEERNHKCVLGK